jgi:hypothetical protein
LKRAFGMLGSRVSLIGLAQMDINPIVQKKWIFANRIQGLIQGRG